MASARHEQRPRALPRVSRRGPLADAAIAVLAREGGRGLTHRAVDREAGVPEGTAKNYFPTREALLEAAARRMAEEHRAAVRRLRETTPRAVTAEDVGALYPALLRRAVDVDPAPMLAMFELYLEAVRRPGVRAALGEMAVANARAAAELHRGAGLPTSVRDAGLLDVYFLGAAISLLALPAEARRRVGLDDPESVGGELFAAVVSGTNACSQRRDRAAGESF
jgi:AcrR family transcriptional regulator